MTGELHARVHAQLKLALLGGCGCRRTLANLEDQARSTGLTGAEIDAALAGRSFEAQTAAALAFACAIKAGEEGAIDKARDHAIRFGVTAEELGAVADEAKRILASMAR